MKTVAELQKAVVAIQDLMAKHAKVLDNLIDGFDVMDKRLKKLEAGK